MLNSQKKKKKKKNLKSKGEIDMLGKNFVDMYVYVLEELFNLIY
jgi:hypothetical protein